MSWLPCASNGVAHRAFPFFRKQPVSIPSAGPQVLDRLLVSSESPPRHLTFDREALAYPADPGGGGCRAYAREWRRFPELGLHGLAVSPTASGLRAALVLKGIGTPAVQGLLQVLASGATATGLKQDARAALGCQ